MHIIQKGILIFCLAHQYNCETYTSKYDGIDLDEILGSDRLLTGYVNCLLDSGACTPDGKELKKNLPDAIENDCRKCTEKQRTGADEIMHYIIDHRPEDWDKLEKKYSSDGTYKLKYLATKEIEKSKSKTSNVTEDDENNYEEDSDYYSSASTKK